MLGLFALFYATIHLLVWMSFLLVFRWQAIGEELIERPYITVGFVAYMILLALGVTSPKAMVRRLGKNWKKLHRLVYIAGILAVVHLLWILRTDVWEAVVYGAVLAVLLGFGLFAPIICAVPEAVRQSIRVSPGCLVSLRQLRIIRRLARLPGWRAGRIDNLHQMDNAFLCLGL